MSTSDDLNGFQRVALPSGERPSHPFRVEVLQRNQATSWDTRIVVLDGWDGPVAEGDGAISTILPRGLYTVRLERGGVSNEVVVGHLGPGPTAERLLEPKRPSAMPSFDTVDAHEYYSYTAARLSQANTRNAQAVFGSLDIASPRLFIFIRALNDKSVGPRNLVESLFLYDLDGQLLTDFSDDVVEIDASKGWVAFSAPAMAGTYILRHAGLQQREMALAVHPNWDTQLFVPFQERPLLERASLQLAHKGVPFNPDDRLAQAIDSGLAGLQAGMDLMTREGRQVLLNGKFDNPMLGLVGAHLLLFHEKPKRWLLDAVVGNLDYLLPESADVTALRLAVALRFGEPLPSVPPMTIPPMLQRGLDAVLQASTFRADIVPEGSFIEQIAPYLVADSVWTIWSPPAAVAGTTSENPTGEISRLAGQLLEQKLMPARGGKTGAQQLSQLIEQELPGLLNSIGPAASAGVQQALRALASTHSEHKLARARDHSEDALRQTAMDLVLEGVDAALRTQPERTTIPAPGAVLPTWIWSLLEDALARSRKRGEALDLAQLAKDARLPLGAIQRWVAQMVGSFGGELTEAVKRFLETGSRDPIASEEAGEAQKKTPDPDTSASY